MQKYQYAIARYTPDPVRGEFLNIGVVIHDLESKRTYTEFTTKIQKIRQLAPDANVKALQTIVEFIEHGITRLDVGQGFLHEAVSGASGLISFSPVRGGLTNNIGDELHTLYNQFVSIDKHDKNFRPRHKPVQQRSLVANVKRAFNLSGYEPLTRLAPVELNKSLGIAFDFADVQPDKPPMVVQPISLDPGIDQEKMSIATRYYYAANEAQKRYWEGRDAKMVALVLEPHSGKTKGYKEAREIISSEYHVIDVNVRNQDSYIARLKRLIERNQ